MIPWEQYGFELAGEASDGGDGTAVDIKEQTGSSDPDIKMPLWMDFDVM